MVGQSRTPLTRISPETQYQEAYESLRQHDRLIWQTPAIAVVVDGGLIVSTFALVSIWWVRELIIGCGLILTAILTYALIKHRHFVVIEQKALAALEERHAEKCIQRVSVPKSKISYWGDASNPNWLQRQSAHIFFIYGMCFINALLLFLLYLNWAVLDY